MKCRDFIGEKELTHTKALEIMQELSEIKDQEIRHIFADKLLCELLKKHGYDDIVEIFLNMDKWYA